MYRGYHMHAYIYIYICVCECAYYHRKQCVFCFSVLAALKISTRDNSGGCLLSNSGVCKNRSGITEANLPRIPRILFPNDIPGMYLNSDFINTVNDDHRISYKPKWWLVTNSMKTGH